MLRAELAQAEPDAREAGLDVAAHGALGAAAQRAIRRTALAEVILPCATALLAAAAPGTTAAGAAIVG